MRAEDWRRDPDTVGPAADPADDFCRLACLVYGDDDGPHRWAAAAALRTPSIVAGSVHAAAAAGDPSALARHLAEPGAATRPGGPYGWEPLLYLCYSRVRQVDAPAAAALLLDAGADPDAGYLWHGLVPAFTALTGVFGEGEQGPGRQPAHPAWRALATLLLAAGADPNDGQTLYNRMFRPDDGVLELLFEHGLGTGDGRPWRARLGTDPPMELLVRPLTWAAAHGFTDRVRLLLAHGVPADVSSPEGSAVGLAAAAGHREIVALLVAAGAPEPTLDPVAALVAAILAGEPGLSAEPGASGSPTDPPPAGRGSDLSALPAALAARPGLVAEAVDAGADPGLAVRLGFDVSAMSGGQTALHTAAWAGDLAMVRRLVELGADAGARDAHFGTRPLDWAGHAQHQAVVDYLTPLTPD